MVEVTVVCNTYNQVDYIEDAINGFVNQKTDFPFEVVIKDDGSNDGTADVVREYAARYPELIIPILLPENQKGKMQGVGATRYIIDNVARGKYIALCEGDDYWISVNKLQSQYDFLEENPCYSMCIHNAVVADLLFDVAYLSEAQYEDRDKTFSELILEGGGGINPTASFFFRRDYYDEWKPAPVGDHFVLMTLARRGRLRWLAEPMSVYRYKAKGSWTCSEATDASCDWIVRYRDQYISALEWIDLETQGIEHDAFVQRIDLQRKVAMRDLALARFACNQIGLRELKKDVDCRSVVKALIRKRLPSLYKPLGRFELIVRTVLSGQFLSSRLKKYGQLDSLKTV